MCVRVHVRARVHVRVRVFCDWQSCETDAGALEERKVAVQQVRVEHDNGGANPSDDKDTSKDLSLLPCLAECLSIMACVGGHVRGTVASAVVAAVMGVMVVVVVAVVVVVLYIFNFCTIYISMDVGPSKRGRNDALSPLGLQLWLLNLVVAMTRNGCIVFLR